MENVPILDAPETIFDRIISREIAAEILFEDEYTLAFLDIKPNHAGHSLVIPKNRVRNIFDMDAETLIHFMSTVQKVSIAIKNAVAADGINLAMNNEPGAGQVVLHAHMHIIPRYEGDGFKFFPTREYNAGEALEVAVKIRQHIS